MIVYVGLVVLLAVVVANLNQVRISEKPENRTVAEESPTGKMVNPASKYCEETGGVVDIVTNPDGSQFGMCKLGEYACEEWAFFNGSCMVEEDADKIKQALEAKGLNLTDMKVVIYKHLGKYIAGGVVPVSILGGGGYVFAEKNEDGTVNIVADGNGAIMCSMLENYPDYPAFLIPECIDERGQPVVR